MFTQLTGILWTPITSQSIVNETPFLLSYTYGRGEALEIMTTQVYSLSQRFRS